MTEETTGKNSPENDTVRAEWQRPEVRRIDANQAEITPGGAGDAGDLS